MRKTSTVKNVKELGEAKAVPAGPGPFRIHTVAELTGVPEPTLRAWERRYGVPTPDRTISGYRLYGTRELEQVRLMRNLCEEGVSAAEAARSVLARVDLPVDGPAPGDQSGGYEGAKTALLRAVEEFDDRAFDDHLRRLHFFGSALTVFDRVLAPVLIEVGTRWHEGRFTIGQEHFASERIGMFVRDLLRLAGAPPADPPVLCACFADEEHDIGLLGAAVRVATMGFRPIVLGRRSPPTAVRSAVESLMPALVLLAVTVAPPKAVARQLLDEYRSACGSVPLIVGGAGAAALASIVTAAGAIVAPEKPSELRACLRAALARGSRRSHDTPQYSKSRKSPRKRRGLP